MAVGATDPSGSEVRAIVIIAVQRQIGSDPLGVRSGDGLQRDHGGQPTGRRPRPSALTWS